MFKGLNKKRRWLTQTAVQKAGRMYQVRIQTLPRREVGCNTGERNLALEYWVQVRR
jgi:hypothetical protein